MEGHHRPAIAARAPWGRKQQYRLPYCYTTFIHLREIFDQQWAIFSKLLLGSKAAEEQKFLSDLARANTIRNKVMHPVRGYRPTRDDYDFVKDFAARVFAEPA